MTEVNRWRIVVTTIFISLFLAPLLFSLCVASEPAVTLDKVTHDVSSFTSKNKFLSEVVQDNISISGTTTPESKISLKKTVFGETTEINVPVSASGSFVTSVHLEIGPGSTQAVERGDIKVKVVAAQGGATKEIEVPLGQETSASVTPNLVGAVSSGTPGYPHTFVAYNNPWLFYTGQFVDDSGKSVHTTKDAVAAQLGKFSAVSLHYTDDASNIALIKEKNPKIKVFAYINPMFCYKSTDPNSEYQLVVKNHPEWFLYPTEASRQSKTNPIVYDGTEQVMDLTTGWRDEVIKISIEALAKGFDGLYIDCVCDDPSLCYGYASSTAPAGNWHSALNTYLTQVRLTGKQNFYNGQSPAVVTTNQDFLDRTDGWMDEGFISYKGWKTSAIDMPQYASAQNKFTMFYAVNPSTSVRQFYFTSALLSDGYFFYAPAFTQWFAEYGTYLGNPKGQAYEIQGLSGVWARDYNSAKVIVNPTSNAVTVSTVGYIDASGKSVSQVTIGSNEGIILRSLAKSTQLTLTASTTNPPVGQTVTITVNLKSGSSGLSKSVKIWHTANGQTWQDGTHTTTNGVYSFTQLFGSTGQRIYHAEFAGDSSYASSSGTVTVNVGTTSATTTTTITASTTNPPVGQTVTITVNLKSGSSGLSKSVKIWHTANGQTWQDGTHTTTNGVYSFTQAFSTTGQRVYHAEFAGDSSYGASSGTVTVNVLATTTTTLSASTTSPAVGKSVTFTATLKSGTTLLSGKWVTIYHYLNGKPYIDTTKSTNANGQITFTQTFGSTGPRAYYATFAGDSTSGPSTSSVVTINVS